jgi:hypothetical protein
MKLANEVLGLIEEGNPIIKGVTSKTNNHWHRYNLDNEGSGDTDASDGHGHKVVKFKVSPEGGHTHELEANKVKQYKQGK